MHFEANEKKLEVDFLIPQDDTLGLRRIPRGTWDELLAEAQCEVVSTTKNDHLDAYVLSESSLFVYRQKTILKTCGTTTLLRALPKLLQATEKLGFQLDFVQYSRRNYFFPEDQPDIHQTFAREVDYLGTLLPGSSFTIGAENDCWHLFVRNENRLPPPGEQCLEICMYELDPDVMKIFYGGDAKRQTQESGIANLLPAHAVIDDFGFTPCGYSMNAVAGQDYYTIHITPEEGQSYVSFETNAAASHALVAKVVQLFRPRRFAAVFFADANLPHALGLAFADVPGFRKETSRRDILPNQTGVVVASTFRASSYPVPDT